MPQIAIDFLRGPDWSSRLIAWFGQGAGGYSHVASVLADGRYLDARSDVLERVDPNCKVPEIVPPGVHIRDPKSERWIKRRRATLDVSQADYDAWEGSLRAKVTDGYGKVDIVDFIFGHARHIAGHYICSALAINAVQHMCRAWTGPSLVMNDMRRLGYVPYPLSIPAHQITPNAALLLVEEAGFTLGPEEFA